MKKYLTLLFAALFAAMTISLTSCGNDEPDSDDIVGTWENTTEWATAIGKEYIKFQKDAKFYEVTVYNDGEVNTLRGTWSKDGNTVKISGKEVISVTSTISDLTSSSMTLTTMGIAQSYKKVPDSTIDKYIE